VPRPRRPLSDQQRALLERAWEAQLELEHARQQRDELAREAARLGASWREIGAAVGMSPQAAHKRYRTGSTPPAS
jgi:hypothetical protein